MDNIWLAFTLTFFAGISTGIGGLAALFVKKTNTRMLSTLLGFSAGVMIYVSFVEILVKSQEFMFSYFQNESSSHLMAVMSFFLGIIIIAIIDRLVPKIENPHEPKLPEDLKDKELTDEFKKLHSVGIMTAIAIAIHNFPEGLVTFLGTLADPAVGVALAIAIAIHNIPEGMAVAVPIYYATGNKLKAFLYALLSGLAEPLGALIGFFILFNFLNDFTLGLMFGLIAGIMVFISLDELLPAAQKFGHHHYSIYGLALGMFVMAISLVLLG